MNTPINLLASLLVLTIANRWWWASSFAPTPPFTHASSRPAPTGTIDLVNGVRLCSMPPGESYIVILGDDDDGEGEEEEEDEEDEEEEQVDPYLSTAKEEFEENSTRDSSALTMSNGGNLATFEDWGGALGKLRQRMEDVETGKSQDPSHALFRLMSAQTPNQLIGRFVTNANPQTVQAMSGAVSSLLGGRCLVSGVVGTFMS